MSCSGDQDENFSYIVSILNYLKSLPGGDYIKEHVSINVMGDVESLYDSPDSRIRHKIVDETELSDLLFKGSSEQSWGGPVRRGRRAYVDIILTPE